MKTNEMLYDSMITPSIDHETSFHCGVCGSMDLRVSLAQYEEGLAIRVSCPKCPNHRDWLIGEEE
jgi:hypothetical protein